MIIASICTIPGRIDSLLKVLSELEHQTLVPDMLLISLFEFYPRAGKFYSPQDEKCLKNFLQDYSIATRIIKNPLDKGPCSKLLTPLTYYNLNDEDFIVILDDDAPLYSRAIEMMMESYKKDPGAVYGLIGGREGKFVHSERIPEGFEYFVVNVLGGYRGVLYSKSLIKEDFIEWVEKIAELHKAENLIAMHDDHIFSFYFKYKRIQRRVCKFIQDSDETHLRYSPIENINGIMNDPDRDKSTQIIEKFIIDKDAEWLLTEPY